GIMFAGRLVKIGTPDELKNSVSKLSVVEVESPNLSVEQLQKLKQKLDVDHASLKCENSILQVTSDRNDDLAERVAATLMAVGAKIRRINTNNPTLEEAFISLTGGEEEIDRFVESATQKK